MPRPQKRIGVGATVSAPVRHLHPRAPWEAAFPETWETERVSLLVHGHATQDVGQGSKEYALVEHHSMLGDVFHVLPGHLKVLRPGPIYANADPTTAAAPAPTAAGAAAGAGAAAATTAGAAAAAAAAGGGYGTVFGAPGPVFDRADSYGPAPFLDEEGDGAGSSSSSSSEPATGDHGAQAPRAAAGGWEAVEAGAVGDGRGGQARLGATLCGGQQEWLKAPAEFFRLFFPTAYLAQHLLLATNAQLAAEAPPVDELEFFAWVGVWLIMALNPGYQAGDFWAPQADARRTNRFWTPPCVAAYMPRARFEAIGRALRLRAGPPPPFEDRFWAARPLFAAFNANMAEAFHPSWLVRLDVAGLASPFAFAPAFAAGRPSEAHGSEVHAVACAETQVVFRMEPAEGAARPREGPDSTPEFDELGAAPARAVRLTRPLWGSGAVVALGAGAAGGAPVACLRELRSRGVHATAAVCKKRKRWQSGVPGDDLIASVQGKPVGTQAVLQGTGELAGVWLGAMAGASQKSAVLASTWATPAPFGPAKRRRIATDPAATGAQGGEAVEFRYGEYQHFFHEARHAVEGHSVARQGSLSLEAAAEAGGVRDWAQGQLFFVLAVVEANALLAYNHFHRRAVAKGRKAAPASKAEFRRMLVDGLVTNAEYQQRRRAQAQACEAEHTRSGAAHSLTKLPVHTGKWNGKEFPRVKWKYQSYACSGCKSKVRTFCTCDRLMRCVTCFVRHRDECVAAQGHRGLPPVSAAPAVDLAAPTVVVDAAVVAHRANGAVAAPIPSAAAMVAAVTGGVTNGVTSAP